MPIPKTVTIVEVGPRDGFQLESTIIPTDLKLDIITGLAASGLRHIQVASFVNPGGCPRWPMPRTSSEDCRKRPRRRFLAWR